MLRTREAVRQLDNLQGNRFQQKMLLDIKEGNEDVGGSGGQVGDDISIGDESTVGALTFFDIRSCLLVRMSRLP